MPRLSSDLPQIDTDAAREGTCAAWVAEMVLTGQHGTTDDLIGKSHENGWLVDTDMAGLVQGYVDRLRDHGGTVYAERRVYLNQMINGTPDAFAILGDDGVLRVDDLKFGYGVVEPYKNTQVSIYAGALLRQLNEPISRVVIGVYQPRAMHPDGIYRKWEVSVDDLMEFVLWIERRGHECQNPEAEATPGSHCKYCPAAGVCVAIGQTLYEGFEFMRHRDKVDMTSAEISNELDFVTMMSDMLNGRKSALETEAVTRVMGGEYIPRWGLEERYGQRKFEIDGDAIKLLTGIDPYDKKLCTPAELIRRGASEKTVNDMSTRPRLKPKLSRQADDHFERKFAKGKGPDNG